MALAAVVAGAWLMFKSRGKLRWAGAGFLVIGALSACVITAFSHLVKISSGASLIDLNLTQMAKLVANLLLPVMLGFSITMLLMAAAVRLSRRHRVVLFAMPMLLAVFCVAGIAGMVRLSLAQTTVNQQTTLAATTLNSHFQIDVYYGNELDEPTSLAFGPDGNLYVALYGGKIVVLKELKRLGRADTLAVFADGLDKPTGLVWRGNDLYVEQAGKISLVRNAAGQSHAAAIEDIVTGLPAYVYPLHANFGLALGPDDRLYFSVGATANAMPEQNLLAARIWSVKPDGSDMREVAKGVRNPYGMAFNKQGDLFATDNAPNWEGTVPGDELKHIKPGVDYGFPKFGMPAPDENRPAPAVIFPQHTSPNGIVFYNGNDFPAEYQNNAFVAFWNTGQIARVQLSRLAGGDYAARWELFTQGLKNPLGVTTGPDGNLYVTDFGANVIYKISANPGR